MTSEDEDDVRKPTANGDWWRHFKDIPTMTAEMFPADRNVVDL